MLVWSLADLGARTLQAKAESHRRKLAAKALRGMGFSSRSVFFDHHAKTAAGAAPRGQQRPAATKPATAEANALAATATATATATVTATAAAAAKPARRVSIVAPPSGLSDMEKLAAFAGIRVDTGGTDGGGGGGGVDGSVANTATATSPKPHDRLKSLHKDPAPGGTTARPAAPRDRRRGSVSNGSGSGAGGGGGDRRQGTASASLPPQASSLVAAEKSGARRARRGSVRARRKSLQLEMPEAAHTATTPTAGVVPSTKPRRPSLVADMRLGGAEGIQASASSVATTAGLIRKLAVSLAKDKQQKTKKRKRKRKRKNKKTKEGKQGQEGKDGEAVCSGDSSDDGSDTDGRSTDSDSTATADSSDASLSGSSDSSDASSSSSDDDTPGKPTFTTPSQLLSAGVLHPDLYVGVHLVGHVLLISTPPPLLPIPFPSPPDILSLSHTCLTSLARFKTAGLSPAARHRRSPRVAKAMLSGLGGSFHIGKGMGVARAVSKLRLRRAKRVGARLGAPTVGDLSKLRGLQLLRKATHRVGVCTWSNVCVAWICVAAGDSPGSVV